MLIFRSAGVQKLDLIKGVMQMDMIYCLLMAIYLLMASNSKQTDGVAQKFLRILSAVMALLAVLHVIT